tara:strand:- start:425 stop:1144 length:720 start_codon:yes stop_codon:yes gene_type:complete
LELWRGPSAFDGSPIVFIATLQTTNRKTGPMIQTWILRQDLLPIDAVKSDDDTSICGECPHRGSTCYVNVGQAPQQIWKSWQRGNYRQVSPADFARHYAEYRSLRLGSYGDPAMIPLDVLDELMAVKWRGNTGYTHQWKWCDRGYRKYLMASVETLAEKDFANELGYRTFRILTPAQDRNSDEILCPASDEGGKRTTCERCRLCSGATGIRKNISIYVHGRSAKRYVKTQEAACASALN